MKYSLVIFILLSSFNSHAGVNKWVDAEGKIHYSDTVPSDVKAQALRRTEAPTVATPANGVAAPKTLAEREAEWKKSQKSKEEVAQKAEQEKEAASIKQKNCANARSNLATYENSLRIISYDDKGEAAYLSEEAHKQGSEDARKIISRDCN